MYGILLEPWMRGYLTSEEVINVICQNTGLDFGTVLHELMLSCQQMNFVSQEIPAYVSSIRAKGIKVVVATDNMDTFVRWTVPSLQLRDMFDDILCSSEVKGLKSDIDEDGKSMFFANYLHDHHIEGGESLLLDDGEEEFGNIIRRFGIAYQHIEPEMGLVPALQTVITSLVYR